ncbi:hypothetical protein EYF80_018182 [Liparis tanakae]|uniref:Uncharacterized protein n=1 Tax=Liparis tanakae TaxID=230148 RepID=A0A4Z2I124_9TELE|nr:hypothetical protein EYF80_018182 [Liparis tanakae]
MATVSHGPHRVNPKGLRRGGRGAVCSVGTALEAATAVLNVSHLHKHKRRGGLTEEDEGRNSFSSHAAWTALGDTVAPPPPGTGSRLASLEMDSTF